MAHLVFICSILSCSADMTICQFPVPFRAFFLLINYQLSLLQVSILKRIIPLIVTSSIEQRIKAAEL